MKILIKITATIALLALACVIAEADCNCGTNGVADAAGGRVPVDPFGAASPWAAVNFVTANHAFANGPDNMAIHEPHPMQADGRRYPTYSSGTAAFNLTRMVPQVPGTLGQTYHRRTHAVSEDKYLRIAMLAVRDPGSVSHLSVQRVSGFRMKDDVWLYETDRPLTSWTENIVRIEARQEAEDVESYKTTFVRLIPGRIVYLDFH